jgi:hypothetical protein
MKQVSHNGRLENVRYLHDLSQKRFLDAKLNLAKASVTERVSVAVPHCLMCKKHFQTDASLESHLWSCADADIGGTKNFLGLNPKGFRVQPQILQKYAAESWFASDPSLGKVTKCPESSKPGAAHRGQGKHT